MDKSVQQMKEYDSKTFEVHGATAKTQLVTVLATIFFFSGFSSLIYQVAWQRLLTVHYGVGTLSITIIISVYMFGLGVGALLGGFLAEHIRKKIITYCIVELGIGFFGIISLPLLNILGEYTAGSDYFVSFSYMFLFLCFPTFLMGITLPLLTKIFNNLIQDFLRSVSLLYFVNTIGAAAGTIFTSYVLISFFGLDNAIYFSVAINLILAVLIFSISSSYTGFQKYPQVKSSICEKKTSIQGGEQKYKVFYFFAFITGFLAIGYEIIWFRVIGVLVKASPYAFSSILSVYLFGIAVGSFWMNRYLRKQKRIDRKNLFFLLQFLIAVFIILIFIGYFYTTKHTFLSIFTRGSFSSDLHPYFAIPSVVSIKYFLLDIYRLLDVFFWSMIFVFLPTILMGASFPLMSSLALNKSDQEGKTIGTVYFFNIIGNVLGGVITGLLLLPYLGTEFTLLIFSSIGVLFGLLIINFGSKKLKIKWAYVIIILIANAAFFPRNGQLYEVMHTSPGKEFKAYFEEGMDGIVMTYQHGEKLKNYINGLSHGSRPGYSYYYETIETVSFSNKRENILVIGFGSGSITETILMLDNVQKITIVELNSTLMNNLIKMPLFKNILNDTRVNLIIDDGRRFLLRTHEKFDMILIDPLRSTTSYSNNLYSKQFFKLIKKHLKPNGIFMVWMNEHCVMPKTVLSTFEQVRMYNRKHSAFCIASNMPFKKNEEIKRSLLNSFSTQQREMILEAAHDFLGDQFYVRKMTKDYPINQDWKPVCEYYLGLKLHETCSIY